MTPSAFDIPGDIQAIFPEHKCGLFLSHNEHRGYYETIEQFLEGRHNRTWVSEDQKTKAIETDSFWQLQWYPETPNGFYSLFAADLDVLLARAKEVLP